MRLPNRNVRGSTADVTVSCCPLLSVQSRSPAAATRLFSCETRSTPCIPISECTHKCPKHPLQNKKYRNQALAEWRDGQKTEEGNWMTTKRGNMWAASAPSKRRLGVPDQVECQRSEPIGPIGLQRPCYDGRPRFWPHPRSNKENNRPCLKEEGQRIFGKQLRCMVLPSPLPELLPFT